MQLKTSSKQKHKTQVISSVRLHLLVLHSVGGCGWFMLTATITLWEEEERISRAELRLRCRTFSRMSEAECLRPCLPTLAVISPAMEWRPLCSGIFTGRAAGCTASMAVLTEAPGSAALRPTVNHQQATITRVQREANATYQFISSI